MLTTNRLGYSNSQKMASLSSLGGTLQLHWSRDISSPKQYAQIFIN
jgi:hypothetical protein